MGKRIFLSIALYYLLITVSPVFALTTYTSIGSVNNDSDPSVWQTYQFDVSQYISGSSNSTLYFDFRNDAPYPPYEPDATISEAFFGIDPESTNYFAHFEYLGGADTNHFRNVWLDIDNVNYVDQYGPYNNHLGNVNTGTSSYGSPDGGPVVGYNIKGEIGTFDATTYILSQLIGITSESSYVSENILLGDTFSFDYWWKMGQEFAGLNFDIMYFRDNTWQLLGGDINFGGSSSDWETVSYVVPDNLRGLNTQIKFIVSDLGVETDPTVYLRNIASNGAAPVPEPVSILLLGAGLIGLARFRKQLKK